MNDFIKNPPSIQVAFQLGNFLLNGGDALHACMKTLRCHLGGTPVCEALDGRKCIPIPTPL